MRTNQYLPFRLKTKCQSPPKKEIRQNVLNDKNNNNRPAVEKKPMGDSKYNNCISVRNELHKTPFHTQPYI